MRTEPAARSPPQAPALGGQAGLASGRRRHLRSGRPPRRRVGEVPAGFKAAPARGRGLGGARGLRGPDGAGDPGGSAPGGKARVPGASACLFKCQGLRSRPGSPEPDLQSRPSRSGACCSPGPSGSRHRRAGEPSGFFLLLLAPHLPREPVEGERPPPQEARGAGRTGIAPRLPVPRRQVAEGARHASLPAAQLRRRPRPERRDRGAHTCKLALEVPGCAGPHPDPHGLHLSAGEFAQVTRARGHARGGRRGGESVTGEPGRVAHLPGPRYPILAASPGEGGAGSEGRLWLVRAPGASGLRKGGLE